MPSSGSDPATLRVHAIALARSDDHRDRYTLVVEKPDGERIECAVEAVKPGPDDDFPIIALDATKETYRALLEFEAPTPPSQKRARGALVIPVLNRMVRLVSAFRRGEVTDFPVELSTEDGRWWDE